MQKTIEVAKGVKVPLAFTIEALEDFCEETETGLPYIYYTLVRGKGQFKTATRLLYHVVKAGFEDLGEKMPYSLAQVEGWLKGTKGPINYPLLSSFVAVASQVLLSSNQEETQEEEVAEEQAEETKN